MFTFFWMLCQSLGSCRFTWCGPGGSRICMRMFCLTTSGCMPSCLRALCRQSLVTSRMRVQTLMTGKLQGKHLKRWLSPKIALKTTNVGHFPKRNNFHTGFWMSIMQYWLLYNVTTLFPPHMDIVGQSSWYLTYILHN